MSLILFSLATIKKMAINTLRTIIECYEMEVLPTRGLSQCFLSLASKLDDTGFLGVGRGS